MSAFTHALSTNNYGPAKFVVATSAANGTHTTIASAITAASSGDTIFIRPGTYTENITLKAGVNITAYAGDGIENNVIILGKTNATGAGTFNISNVQLKTNSDFCLLVDGSSATVVNLEGVYINGNNNTAISYTTSSASSIINIYNSVVDLQTTGIAYYSMSSTGTLNFFSTNLLNTGASTTAASNSAGGVVFYNCRIAGVLSTSSSGNLSTRNCDHNTTALNATCITTAGTGALHGHSNTFFASGTASAISVGAGTTVGVNTCSVNSSNTNAITGAGSLNYVNVALSGTSLTINTTTQTGGYVGNRVQAPTTGFIGEQLTANAAAVATTSTTAKTITSVTLTPGIWDVSGQARGVATGGTVLTQNILASISTTDNTQNLSNAEFFQASFPAGTAVISAVLPPLRATVTTNTTYYLVVTNTYTSTTCPTDARITATRVG